MITEGSIVRGTLDSGDTDLIMGLFMVTEVDGDTVYMRCISHEADDDNVSEDFESEIQYLELVSECKGAGIYMTPNPMKMMSPDVPTMSAEDMAVLGLI